MSENKKRHLRRYTRLIVAIAIAIAMTIYFYPHPQPMLKLIDVVEVENFVMATGWAVESIPSHVNGDKLKFLDHASYNSDKEYILSYNRIIIGFEIADAPCSHCGKELLIMEKSVGIAGIFIYEINNINDFVRIDYCFEKNASIYPVEIP